MELGVYIGIGLMIVFVTAFVWNLISFFIDLTVFNAGQKNYERWASPNRKSRRDIYFYDKETDKKEQSKTVKKEEKVYTR